VFTYNLAHTGRSRRS